MERFSCKTKLICGSGAVSALKELEAKRLLLVADPYFVENGTARNILACAQAERAEIFGEVQPDPTVKLAARGTALMKELNPDTVVALGGGSAMDCAKAMVYFARSDALLAAIPTTSGSGAEVTDFAVLTHKGVKHPLVDERLRPDVAILDSDLLTNLPKSLVADGGFDVLAHALEAAVATGSGAMTDLLAREAFTVAYGYLPASYNGSQKVRLQVHRAAAMAGMAFTQAGLGLCHAISHALGGMFHVPHGRLNAILLPAVISCNAHAAGEKYAAMARAAGIGGSTDAMAVRNLRSALIRLRRELDLPQTLVQAGVQPRQLWSRSEEIVRGALADPCCRTNPVPAEEFLIRRILEEAAGHA